MSASNVSLTSMIETHDEPFVVLDKGLKVVAVNRAYERRFGVDRKDMVNRPCYRVFQCRDEPCELGGESCPHRKILENLKPYAGILSHCDAAGNKLQVRAKGFPLTDDDGELYVGEILAPLNEVVGAEHTPQMVGHSPAFMELVSHLERAAKVDIPILLEGETGTGKELAAAFVHSHSRRHDKELVTVDCTVLAEDLFESELFGHERGAYTGAAGSKVGLFELADGSTLFLDEVGEMPLGLQVKLLRALESGTFRRVGGTRTLRSDVRLVCATNRSLQDMVERGEFRQDLYYRIAVFPVAMPSLRQRRLDIPLIAATLLERMAGMLGRQMKLSREAQIKLLHYDFPGNIRELRNILQLAAALSHGGVIGSEEIRLPERSPLFAEAEDEDRLPAASEIAQDGNGFTPLQNMEVQYIQELLRRYNGRRSDVARAMGVSERTLYRKLKRFELN